MAQDKTISDVEVMPTTASHSKASSELGVAVNGELQHLAIIMDGNGRWANSRGLPRTAGHKKGASIVREVTAEARSLGIKYLTLFGFSSENWQRPEQEVSDLMGLLSYYLSRETKGLIKEGVKLKIIGDRSRFSTSLQKTIVQAEHDTAECQNQTLVLALSYGGRQEIVDAAKTLANQVKAGTIDVDEINIDKLGNSLNSSDIPDPDLILRTSGEQRISNFLLWQSAYAELAFTDTLWPDFTGDELRTIVAEFCKRDRRFGKVNPDAT
ncbi:MAG: isoprenyl transferase [Alphaproteobacteria bacterium]